MLLYPIFDEMDAIEKRTREEDKAYYQPQIDSLAKKANFLETSCRQLEGKNNLLETSCQQLRGKNNLLETSCQQLTTQIQQLQNLLAQNNIPFNQGVNQ